MEANKFRSYFLLYAENQTFWENRENSLHHSSEILDNLRNAEFDAGESASWQLFGNISLILMTSLISLAIAAAIYVGFLALANFSSNPLWLGIAILCWLLAFIATQRFGRYLWIGTFEFLKIFLRQQSSELLYKHIYKSGKFERGRFISSETNGDYTTIHYRFIDGHRDTECQFLTKSEDAKNLKTDDSLLVLYVYGYSILL